MRIILITGCSSGFGYLSALKFARHGDYVFAAVRNKKSEGAKNLSLTAKKEFLSIEVIECDVTSDKSIQKAVRAILQKKKKIDVLINNAGYGYMGPVEQTPITDIRKLYDTNIFGIIRMTQAVVPIMRKKHKGLIINISSINGVVPFPLFSIYSTSKFAVETLTEGLRFELKHFGINVTMIEPGSFLTSLTKNRKQSPALRQKNSPYRALIENFFSRYAKTHREGDMSVTSKTANPQIVANTLYKISLEKKPDLRYLVGGDAYKFYILRKMLPTPVWEWLLHKVYKW